MERISQAVHGRVNAVTVMRTGALGDFVLTLPAIQALRDAHPEAELRLIGSPHLAQLARPDSIVDQDGPHLAPLFTRDGPLPAATRQIFEREGHCLAYSSAGEILAVHLREMVAGPVVVWDPRPDSAFSGHITEHLLEPLKQMGIEAADAQPRIHISRDVLHGFADQALPAGGAAPVAVHPGSGGRHKCWPLVNYVALIRELSARQQSVVILLGPAETEIETALGPLAVDGAALVRPPGPWELASILARSALFIGNDSGPGHLAAAVGTPTLSLFGPTDPKRWCPVGPRCRVLRVPGGNLEALRVDVVLNAALEELGLG